MEEKLTEILVSKSFSELTVEERSSFTELFASEEEYESLQSLFVQLEDYKKHQPIASHHKTKVALDELFEEKHRQAGFLSRVFPLNKPFYLTPVFQIAAILVIIILLYPLTQSEVEKPIELAKNEVPTKKDLDTPQKNKNIQEKTVAQPELKQSNTSKSNSTVLPLKNTNEDVNSDFKNPSYSSVSPSMNGQGVSDFRAESDYVSSSNLASKDQEKSVSSRSRLDDNLLMKEESTKEEDVKFSTVLTENKVFQKNEKQKQIKVKSLGENTSVLAVLTAIY